MRGVIMIGNRLPPTPEMISKEKKAWKPVFILTISAYALSALAIFSDMLLLRDAYTALEVLQASLLWLRIALFGSTAMLFILLVGYIVIIVSSKRKGTRSPEVMKRFMLLACIILAMFIFFLPLREGLPTMLAIPRDIAAIESGELEVFTVSFDTELLERGLPHGRRDPLMMSGGTYRGLYTSFGGGRWVQYPRALSTSVLREMSPAEIYAPFGRHLFEMTVTPILGIVVDAVPLFDDWDPYYYDD